MASTDNPFAMPTDTTGMNTARHGSAEQNTGTANGTYLDSMTGNTPPSTPRVNPTRTREDTPRGTRRTRARSETRAREEDADYQDRREERQERREGQEPVGLRFRLNAIEQTLRGYQDELVAQRVHLQQLNEAVVKLNTDKEQTGIRLDQVFSLVDQRFTEAQTGAQEIREATHQRCE